MHQLISSPQQEQLVILRNNNCSWNADNFSSMCIAEFSCRPFPCYANYSKARFPQQYIPVRIANAFEMDGGWRYAASRGDCVTQRALRAYVITHTARVVCVCACSRFFLFLLGFWSVTVTFAAEFLQSGNKLA